MQEYENESPVSENVDLSDDVNASLGLNGKSEEPEVNEGNELPEFAKKKLGMQEKRHKKQLRQMQQRLEEMQNRMSSHQEVNNYSRQNDNFDQPQGQFGNDQIYQAVAKAMQLQEEQKKKAENERRMQNIHKHYKEFQNNLDNFSKYDDFDEVINDSDAPYTNTMRDTALIIPNAAETLYHLGKDRAKLEKIASLDPIDQAKEVIKMSIALLGGPQKSSSEGNARPLGSIKNNPVNNTGISEGTSIGDIRRRMREGNKWGK